MRVLVPKTWTESAETEESAAAGRTLNPMRSVVGRSRLQQGQGVEWQSQRRTYGAPGG